MNTSTLLTAGQVAERLHCSLGTVHRELRSGRMRGSKPRKIWLIPEPAVEEYLAKYSNEQQPETARRRRRRKW